jgi:phospholipase C
MAQNDPIKHIVVLMMENHSFDELLGWTKTLYPAIDSQRRSSHQEHRQEILVQDKIRERQSATRS